MFKSRTIVALAAFALLGVFVVVKATRKDPHLVATTVGKASAAPRGAPARVNAADVDQLDVVNEGKTTRLKKEGGRWKLTAPVADDADQGNVAAAVNALADLQFKEVVAESKDSYEKLAITDAEVVRVTASKGGKPLLVLLVGKNGQVRVGDEPRVWSVAKLNRFVFTREPKMWRNRELFRFESADIAQLESTIDGQKLVVKHDVPPAPVAPDGGPPPPPAPDKWILVEGQAAVGGALDESAPTLAVSQLSRLDIGEFVDDGKVTDPGTGLDAPRVIFAAVLKDGTRKSIEIGKEEGQWVYARLTGDPRVFFVRKSTADALVRAPVQWRDKTVAKLDGKDVVKLDVVKGDAHVTYERVDEKTWKAVEPKDQPELDSARVTSVVNSFANLRAQQISSLGAKDAKTGLAKPTGKLQLWKKGEAAPALVITVGALDDRAYYLQVTGRPEVFTISDASVNRWLKASADDYKPAAGPPPGMGGLPPGAMPPGMMPPGH
jgi:hypothetical protein